MNQKQRINLILERLKDAVKSSDEEGTAEVSIFAVENDVNWLIKVIEQQKQDIQDYALSIQEINEAIGIEYCNEPSTIQTLSDTIRRIGKKVKDVENRAS
ncbi:hypothetical protein ACSVDA_15405 [Cytobacillus sp. Hm23]